MRIHVYLREFPPTGDPLDSGMIKAVHGLAAGFARHGAQVTVLCEGEKTGVVDTPAGYEIRCFAHNNPRRPTLTSLSRQLEQYIDRCPDPGLFLLNGIFSPCVYMVARACRRNRIPYVFAPHDPYHPSIFDKRWHLKWAYWYLRERPMLRRASAIQVLDLRHAEWLRRLGVHTPVLEVLNGWAPEDVQPIEALSWRDAGPPRLLYMGRIDSHNKGLDILLEAFAQLLGETDANLTIQGPDWGDLEAMKQLAGRLGLGRRAEFREPDYTIASSFITAQHDVFVLPSRFEGFGLSALEAMLSARVMVVSDVAGIAPHVRASGCGVVVASDSQHIKQGIRQILAMRPKWKQMGLAGREYALQKLRWETIAAETIEKYRALLGAEIGRTAALRNCAASIL
ncbi:glycosyltransferase [Fontivita pretiosa]|uniref:glycosyltransferase n=1 Tax=Fontivita pretiosa TaxID=2989684 RepID=UPI003D181D37